jgi:hypothetical protein
MGQHKVLYQTELLVLQPDQAPYLLVGGCGKAAAASDPPRIFDSHPLDWRSGHEQSISHIN